MQSISQRPVVLLHIYLGAKSTAYVDGNPCLALGHAQKCGGVKLVNGIITIPF
jgi:hypothetical protein